MASIRVLSGHGRYTDPWHPFAEGSAAIREILEAVGHRVEVRDDDVSCLQELDALDLVVVNLGGNVEVELEHDDEWAAAQHEFGQWIRGGGRVLAVHTAANSFPDWPEWPALLGGQWVRGTSWHPKRCIATFGKAPGRRIIRFGLGSTSSPSTTRGTQTSSSTRAPLRSFAMNSVRSGR